MIQMEHNIKVEALPSSSSNDGLKLHFKRNSSGEYMVGNEAKKLCSESQESINQDESSSITNYVPQEHIPAMLQSEAQSLTVTIMWLYLVKPDATLDKLRRSLTAV